MVLSIMRVAAVDVGSNTVRLLVADAVDGALRRLDRRSIVTRLAQGVDRSGRLDPAAVERSLDAVEVYAAAIGTAGCDRVGVIATSAVRDAANRSEFTEPAGALLGVAPVVLTGPEEAEMSFAGAVTGAIGEPPFLVIDLGGGSTEFVSGTDRVEWGVSVDIGSVRLTERMLPNRPAPSTAVEAARRHVAGLFAEQVKLPAEIATVIGVGGTFTSLTAIHLGLEEYDSERVHGTVVPVLGLDILVDELARLDPASTAAIPSLDPARAPVLLGGAVVAATAIRHVGAIAVTVSERDILDGLALALVSGTAGLGASTGSS
jgi:exopolyphosphatase/guanosine-5'-triphosphate,3'-diphosphate pyrophosphatase